MEPNRFSDHRIDQQPLRDDALRSQLVTKLETNNAMWGWVAGAVVLALVLVFVFSRGQSSDTTANNLPTTPAVTTGTSSPTTAPTVAQQPRPAPASTGSGSSR
ncbi:MAG: hypothetical protein NTV56_19855 [Alphaproteobacteria bacterium]|nr:hypothetical protein [Alphaproteobacteria bacterium]